MTTRSADGQVYHLGHWESMQMALALQAEVDTLKEMQADPHRGEQLAAQGLPVEDLRPKIEGLENLCKLFAQSHTTVSIIVTPDKELP